MRVGGLDFRPGLKKILDRFLTVPLNNSEANSNPSVNTTKSLVWYTILTCLQLYLLPNMEM